MSQPLVSIVTPTLNRAMLLEQTLQSVAAQTYARVEHIVIDGGSTDDTLDVLRRYEGEGRLRWISEPDHGMYEAINKGLALARGDILAYLNSDDLYFPWTVAVVAKAFQRDERADFVFGDVLSVDDGTHAQRIHWQYPFDLDYIRRVGFLAQPAVFWRRGVIEEEGGFDQTLKYVADCDFWMRTGQRRRFLKTNEMLAIEREHGATLRAEHRQELAAELRDVRSRYVNLLGPSHRIALARHRGRIALIRRLYWLAFLVRVFLPRVVNGPWALFLASGAVRVSAIRALAFQIPIVGLRFEDSVLAGTPYLAEHF